MNLEAIDHLVLTVRDIEATCAFYARVLGVEVITFDEGRKALRFGAQKINLHELGREFEPKALYPTAGSGDACFLTCDPLEEVVEHLRAHGIDIIEGPVRKTGARGPIESVYLRDPDGNLLEIARYLGEASARP
jgi:catechol 2,3-dioxygenase-like lactoylglutathione lyase family enzyme